MTTSRREDALSTRMSAAYLAARRSHPDHVANGDELRFRHRNDDEEHRKGKPSYLASFTKGLAHDYDTGLVDCPDDFQLLVRGIDSGELRDFQQTPLGPDRFIGGQPGAGGLADPEWKSEKAFGAGLRAWESAAAGNTFDLEGPDSQAVTMPPAPRLGSAELTAEMGEVYAQAMLRDVPFSAMSEKAPDDADRALVLEILQELNKLDWFSPRPLDGLKPSPVVWRRRRS